MSNMVMVWHFIVVMALSGLASAGAYLAVVAIGALAIRAWRGHRRRA